MLTAKQIINVGRMLSQTGEARGFSNDWSPSINTKSLRAVADDFAATEKGNPDKGSVNVSLVYEADPVTGDVRIVPK